MSDFYGNNQGYSSSGQEGFGQQQPPQQGGFTPAPPPATVAQAIAGSGGYQSPAPSGFSPAPASYEAPAPAPQQSGYGSGNGGNSYGSSGGNPGYGGNNSYQRPNNNGGGFPRQGGNGGKFQGRPPLTPQQLEALRLPKAAVITGNYNAQENVRPLVQEAINMLRHFGYILRVSSGKGIDDMALQAAGAEAEIYLPFRFDNVPKAHSTFNGDECKEFSRRHVPNWGSVPEKQHSFYHKTTRMVLGKNCKEPAQLTIIWSDDGVESAATSTPKSGHAGYAAILSRAINIPVFNLNNPNALQRLKQYLEG